jgi:ParB family chromosome partitioning protein
MMTEKPKVHKGINNHIKDGEKKMQEKRVQEENSKKSAVSTHSAKTSKGLGKGLGRGLNAFIPDGNNDKDNVVVKEVVKEVVVKEPAENKLKISLIEPNREQPRKAFDEDALIELSESIKQYGVLQPLLVQKKDGYYEIIAGERRWRAAKLAGVKEVPVIIKDYSTQEVMEIALIENIQREDLNPIEEAQAYQRLIRDYRLKQDEVAEKVSKSRAAITNSLRLLKLDQRVQDMVMEGKLSNGHARTIIGIEDGDKQYMIAQKIFDEKLSVRETEKLMKQLDKPEKAQKEKPMNDFVYRDLEDKIKKIMGTKVVIKNKNNNKGKIEIDYYSQEELERIYEMIKHINE